MVIPPMMRIVIPPYILRKGRLYLSVNPILKKKNDGFDCYSKPPALLVLPPLWHHDVPTP